MTKMSWRPWQPCRRLPRSRRQQSANSCRRTWRRRSPWAQLGNERVVVATLRRTPSALVWWRHPHARTRGCYTAGRMVGAPHRTCRPRTNSAHDVAAATGDRYTAPNDAACRPSRRPQWTGTARVPSAAQTLRRLDSVVDAAAVKSSAARRV